MKRRLFLGAAAASPVMAKQAVGSLAGAAGSPDMLTGWSASQNSPAMPVVPSRPDFRKMLAEMSLDKTRDEVRRRMRALMYERQLMNMRSLSQPARDRMVVEYQACLEYENSRSRLLGWIKEQEE